MENQRSPNLIEAKKLRKQTEQDAQLLANRIKLLQQEEMRTWKKIEDARKKAQDLKATKKQQEDIKRQQSELKTQRERALSEQRHNYNRIREERKIGKYSLKQAILQSRKEEANDLRKQREDNTKRIKEMMDYFREENEARKHIIKNNELSATQRINE